MNVLVTSLFLLLYTVNKKRVLTMVWSIEMAKSAKIKAEANLAMAIATDKPFLPLTTKHTHQEEEEEEEEAERKKKKKPRGMKRKRGLIQISECLGTVGYI